jgi:hypothetical protein
VRNVYLREDWIVSQLVAHLDPDGDHDLVEEPSTVVREVQARYLRIVCRQGACGVTGNPGAAPIDRS